MRLATTFFIFLFPLLSFSQNLFVNTFGINSAEERAFDMVVLSDGSVITVGDRYDTDNSQRTGHLLKVDPFGFEEWNRQLLSNQDLYATTICQLPNGNVFVLEWTKLFLTKRTPRCPRYVTNILAIGVSRVRTLAS